MSKTLNCILHEIEDMNTGAVAAVHVIEYYAVDLKYKTVTATVNGYVGKAAYNNGKQALCSHTLTIHGLPDDASGINLDWLYSQAVLPDSGSVFAGAKLGSL